MGKSGRLPDGRIGTQIRLDAELHDQLKEAARERDVSVNWLVNKALREMLERLKPASEFHLTRQEPDR